MKAVILLCLSVYCCVAQQPTPCTTPAQFESRVFQDDPSRGWLTIGHMSYDANNERFTITEFVELNTTREFYKFYFLHKQQRKYEVNLRTNVCNSSALTRPFRPMGVPPFAKFNFAGTIGPVNIPNEHVSTTNWEGEFENHDKFMVTVEAVRCTPLQQFFFSNDTGLIISDFYDTTIGIVDPMVFDLPPSCKP